MSLPNRNPETGIRYGYISAQSLDPEIVDELQQDGVDVHWHERREELEECLRNSLSDFLSNRSIDCVIDVAVEAMGNENFYDDEPVHEGEREGVRYRTSWLGGALHVWVFSSPHTGMYQECSPCVPGAGNLDCPDPDGVLTCDVPADWRVSDE